jgi:hypothetical protein
LKSKLGVMHWSLYLECEARNLSIPQLRPGVNFTRW